MSTTTATTKERILDAAEEIMLRKSFHSVGLNEILAAVKVPKGSFYHYFKSKEQFGVELLRHYVAESSAFRRKMLLSAETEPNPFKRLMAFFEMSIARLDGNDCECPCLVVKLSTEVATFSDDMRTVLADGMSEWRGQLQQLVSEGQKKGVMGKDLKPAAAADMILDLWMGAHHRTQVERSVAPLRTAALFIRNLLKAK